MQQNPGTSSIGGMSASGRQGWDVVVLEDWTTTLHPHETVFMSGFWSWIQP